MKAGNISRKRLAERSRPAHATRAQVAFIATQDRNGVPGLHKVIVAQAAMAA